MPHNRTLLIADGGLQLPSTLNAQRLTTDGSGNILGVAAVTADASGTQTAVIGTEHTLDDVAAVGSYALYVDTTIMAALDVLELRVYQIIITGGTRHVAYLSRYFDLQPTDDAIKYTDFFPNELTDAGSLRFTLKQTAGTGRAFPWKVMKYI